MTPSKIIALFGKPGAGKTHLAERVAEQTGWTYLTIDQFGPPRSKPWPRLVAAARETEGTVIVESNVVPPIYRRLLDEVDHVAVQVVASDADRRARMRARGEELRSTRLPGIRADVRIRSGASGVETLVGVGDA